MLPQPKQFDDVQTLSNETQEIVLAIREALQKCKYCYIDKQGFFSNKKYLEIITHLSTEYAYNHRDELRKVVKHSEWSDVTILRYLASDMKMFNKYGYIIRLHFPKKPEPLNKDHSFPTFDESNQSY
mgnify:CR=1 FL=1